MSTVSQNNLSCLPSVETLPSRESLGIVLAETGYNPIEKYDPGGTISWGL